MTPEAYAPTKEYTRDGGVKGQERLTVAGQATHWMTPNVPNGGRKVSESLVNAKGMTEDGQKRTVGLESQSRYWPTPDVNSGNRDMSKVDPEAQRRPDTKVTIGLPTIATMWPTPSAAVMNDGESPETWHARAALLKAKHGNGNGAGLPLTVATVQWPTPAHRDGDPRRGATSPDSDAWKNKVARGEVNAAGMLSDDLKSSASAWPTPVSSDSRSQLGGGHARPNEEPHGEPEPVASRDALPLFAPGPGDPRWPAILAEHPELAPALEPAFRSVVDGLAFDMGDSRAARLKCVGNGVVALQAAVAVVVLARRAGLFVERVELSEAA